MSSTNDFNALPFTLIRPRPGQPRHQVRRICTLEWNKLFAEAMERDTQESVGIDDADGGYDEFEGNESDDDENDENAIRENNLDMPLKMCNKSNTVPGIVSRAENSNEQMPQSIGNQSKTESGKHSSCTVPNFQSNNKDLFTPRRNHSEGPNFEGKQNVERKKDESKLSSNSYNYNRTPMKEVNYLEPNVRSERKKASDELFSVERTAKHTSNKAGLNCNGESLKVKEINVRNADKKNEQANEVSYIEQADVNYQKQNAADNNNQLADQSRFAVPAVPEKANGKGKKIVVNGKPYQILAPLGKGGSSNVYLVLDTNNKLLAVKCVKLSGVTEKLKNDYLNEIQHLLKMQHSKHVIRLFDHQYVNTHKLLYAVMEKGDTDLSRFLKDKAASEEGITPELIMYYWNEMLLAVKSIHDNNIIHRDLKPANFLLVSGRLKLIDFGIASSIQNEQTSILMDTQSGTFNYMSPEALLDLGAGNEVVLKIGRKTDVWSLGCILYYFLYKKTPYQHIMKPFQKMKAITDPNYAIEFPKLPGMPEILIESCKKCLIHDRKKRASIEELLELKNRPFLTLSQVLGKLKLQLSDKEYEKAEKALIEDFGSDQR